jgi:hypothetical protein
VHNLLASKAPSASPQTLALSPFSTKKARLNCSNLKKVEKSRFGYGTSEKICYNKDV